MTQYFLELFLILFLLFFRKCTFLIKIEFSSFKVEILDSDGRYYAVFNTSFEVEIYSFLLI